MENSNMLRMGGSNPPLPKTTWEGSRAGNALLKPGKKWSDGQVLLRNLACKRLVKAYNFDGWETVCSRIRIKASHFKCLDVSSHRFPPWTREIAWTTWEVRWIREFPIPGHRWPADQSPHSSQYRPIFIATYLYIMYIYMYIIYKIFTTLHWNILKELK